MEFTPRVTIVIPVYNGANYLCEAINSALAQTYKNIEVIVINDGSNDDGKTEEMALSYGSKISYFFKENGGVASALNLGIQKMKGEYFAWLSHDDVYYAEKIVRHIKYLEKRKNKQILTYCDSEIIDKNSNMIRISRINQEYLKHIYLTIFSTSIGGCTLLIPRFCFEKVGLFNEKLKTTQDNEMWLRISRNGFDFEHIPEILVKSRSHSEQGSNKLKDYHQKEIVEFYRWAFNYIGNDIKLIYSDVNRLLLDIKYYDAHNELLKIKYKNDVYIKYFVALSYTFVKYRIFREIYKLSIYTFKCLIKKLNR